MSTTQTTTFDGETVTTTTTDTYRALSMTVLERRDLGRWQITCGQFSADLPICPENDSGECTRYGANKPRKVCRVVHDAFADVSWHHDRDRCHGWHRVRVERFAATVFATMRRSGMRAIDDDKPTEPKGQTA